MRKILVTGFDPFGGESINPAYEAVKLLPEQILDARVIPLEVPTVFDSGPKKVIEAVSELQPDFVLCIGQAGGRSQITPEFVGMRARETQELLKNCGLDYVCTFEKKKPVFHKI